MDERWPIEWLIQVFSFLPISEVIRLRSICKEWRYVADNFILTELSISICEEERPFKQGELLKFSNVYLSSDHCLCYRGIRILNDLHRLSNVFRNLKTLIFSENLQASHEAQGLRAQIFISRFNELFAFSMFRRLPRISSIGCQRKPNFISLSLFDVLDSLKNLVHLELRKYKFNLISSIKLDSLRTLAIHHEQPNKSNFINIYCPNLVRFSTNATNWTPRSCYYMPQLKTLICEQLDEWTHNLKELETLVVRQIGSKDENLLVYLPKLKYLDVYSVRKEDLLPIINGKQQFKKNDLKIFYGALPVCMQQIDEQLKRKATSFSKASSKKMIHFYSDHHSEMLGDLHFLSTIKLLGRLRMIQPAFFRRLRDVREVIVAKDNSRNSPAFRQLDLIRILKELPLVRELTIQQLALSDLNLSFFRKLPKICQPLKLTVHCVRGEFGCFEPDTFDFLLEMNQLNQFQFAHRPFSKELRELIGKFASSHLFRFETTREFILLRKVDS